MLELIYHNAQYMGTRNSYQYKDVLKALAPWPDVLFDGELRVWLVDWRCFDALVEALGSELWAAPDFWLRFPEVMPATQRRRKTKREIVVQRKQEQQAAATVGGAIVGNREVMKW